MTRNYHDEADAGHFMYWSLKAIVDYYNQLKPAKIADEDCLDSDILLIRAITNITNQYRSRVTPEAAE